MILLTQMFIITESELLAAALRYRTPTYPQNSNHYCIVCLYLLRFYTGAKLLVTSNSVTRSLSTTMGSLWEKYLILVLILLTQNLNLELKLLELIFYFFRRKQLSLHN